MEYSGRTFDSSPPASAPPPEVAGFVPRDFSQTTALVGPTSVEVDDYAEVGQWAEPRAIRQPRRGMWVAAVSLAGVAVVALIAGVAISPSAPAPTQAQRDELASATATYRKAQDRTDQLAPASSVRVALGQAQRLVDEIADLQNGSRYLAKAATYAGTLSPSLTGDLTRALQPSFATSVATDLLGPWYLLASDAALEAPAAGAQFPSGMVWKAQTPLTMTVDNLVPVMWLAVQSQPEAGKPALVYAWAQANYDMSKQVFVDLRVGVTGDGQANAVVLR